jgi:hypothetical protein
LGLLHKDERIETVTEDLLGLLQVRVDRHRHKLLLVRRRTSDRRLLIFEYVIVIFAIVTQKNRA